MLKTNLCEFGNNRVGVDDGVDDVGVICNTS